MMTAEGSCSLESVQGNFARPTPPSRAAPRYDRVSGSTHADEFREAAWPAKVYLLISDSGITTLVSDFRLNGYFLSDVIWACFSYEYYLGWVYILLEIFLHSRNVGAWS